MTESDRRLGIALAAAVTAHAALLFAVTLPSWSPSSTRAPLTVTLSTAPGARQQSTTTIAAADQTGTDSTSRHSRAAGDSPELTEGEETRSKTPGSGENAADIPLLARLTPQAGLYTGRGQRQAGGSSAQIAVPETMRRRTAAADPRAAYLEAWRNGVERIGNRDLPRAVLANMRGERRLTMEVTLAADGRLLDMRIRRGSGYPQLDAAARRILRDAAPFTPFPAALRERWPQLTFAYDWRFLPERGNTLGVEDVSR